MITVLLYGHLRKRFGKFHRFDIRSPADAIQALAANFPEFRPHLLEHSEPGYRILVGRESRDESTLRHPADDVIRIVPVVSGAGGGWGQVILGGVLAVVGVFTGFTFLTSFGVSMALGGIAQLLAPAPRTYSPAERPENLPSYGFDGATNTVAQGNPVPLFYGEGIVGSQQISVGLSTVSI
ncbi:tail assembly protein [Thauera sinica]|uniref:Tail assembly protein n=1 Tax=Thauera sinica TaxID=2665146 RepID=A0ABW1AR98_9RHOO|nr:tail assembly protein [Thauera sp. K11]ATE60175.1 phage tail protein [Thauera sp. K11]